MIPDWPVAIFGILWPTIMAVGLRPLAGHLAYYYAHKDKRQRPNVDQWTGGIAAALALLLIWPVSLLWLVLGTRASIGAERTAVRARAEEKREADQKRLKARMQELESNLLEKG